MAVRTKAHSRRRRQENNADVPGEPWLLCVRSSVSSQLQGDREQAFERVSHCNGLAPRHQDGDLLSLEAVSFALRPRLGTITRSACRHCETRLRLPAARTASVHGCRLRGVLVRGCQRCATRLTKNAENRSSESLRLRTSCRSELSVKRRVSRRGWPQAKRDSLRSLHLKRKACTRRPRRSSVCWGFQLAKHRGHRDRAESRMSTHRPPVSPGKRWV